jgi:hypothetical protein
MPVPGKYIEYTKFLLILLSIGKIKEINREGQDDKDLC